MYQEVLSNELFTSENLHNSCFSKVIIFTPNIRIVLNFTQWKAIILAIVPLIPPQIHF